MVKFIEENAQTKYKEMQETMRNRKKGVAKQNQKNLDERKQTQIYR